MVYTNNEFNVKGLFENLPVVDVGDVPLTKKKHKPCMGKISAKHGDIISVRYQNTFRGLVTDPDVIYKDTIRKLLKSGKPLENDAQKNYVIKAGHRSDPDVSSDEEAYEAGVQSIFRIGHFLNQVTCIICVKGKLMNVMLFKNNFKIAGCKSSNDAVLVSRILWNYIKDMKGVWKLSDKREPRFVIEEAMTNVDFKFGFKIDRTKLNSLMNNDEYKDIVRSSKFEATSNSNVNVKMYAIIPPNFRYKCVEIPEKGKARLISLKTNPYNKKKDKKTTSDVTFLIFHSAKVIMSGKYYETMATQYEIFRKIVHDHRDEVKEQIEEGGTYTH